ncbi:PaaI family thioesterase [Variovorax sp. E3]|uniref:PaaI family thioesterase n=1 Tax=Variovorax sp. E3 TaxID=1914993 RepID=UPI0018DC29BB|nr:hypothetical protein [Variovorax sp. E3]
MNTSPNIQRVLQALNANRTPGWQFPAHYLGLAFEQLTEKRAEVSMYAGPHCIGAQRRVSLEALGVLADVAMAGAVRGRMGNAARVATVSIRLSLGVLPADGKLRAAAELKLNPANSAVRMATTALTVEANGSLCCIGEASFAAIDSRRVVASHPLSKCSALECTQPLAPEELTPEELFVLNSARLADAESREDHAFIERFWGCSATHGDGWAALRVAGGLHTANRVGDIQGGLLLGLGGRICLAALSQDWRLVDLSAQYITASPGKGVVMQAKTLRVGRSLASVGCEAVDDAGNITFRAQASLVRNIHS